MKPRIYDCFCYFNEDMILELRLETLWNYVDYFVIVESTKTISGKEKSVNFKLDKFAKYQEKIRYFLVEDYPFPTDDPWRNERYQRNFLANGFYDCRDDDWIMVSDIDEIPRPEAIHIFNPRKYLRGDLQQYAYAYYLNNLCQENGSPMFWYGTKILTYKTFNSFFKSTEQVRNYKSSGLLRAIKRAWFKRFHVQIIANGGWHFSWIGKIPQLILKLESFAHQEFNKPEFKDPAYIQEKILSGLDILNPKVRYIRQALGDQLPVYLTKNPEKFGDWLILPDA